MKETQGKHIRIDPELHRLAKGSAGLSGDTLFEWIEKAIREKLEKNKEEQNND